MTSTRTSQARSYQARIKPEVIAHAIMILNREVSQPSTEPDRLGGVLMIAVIDKKEGGRPSLVSEAIGDAGEKITRFAFNAHEKFRRLSVRRASGKQEVASSESADNLTMFGGCVVFIDNDGNEVYISISGGPPEVDEAIVYAIGLKLGLNAIVNPENPLIERASALIDRGISPSQ
jgi:hypothetical protein